MDRVLITGLFLSCFGHHFALDLGGKLYVKVGNNIELRPPATAKITRILWKHNENLVAEWATDTEMEYYSTFKGRTTLDTNTGLLVISKTTENDGGTYKVEINDKLLDDVFELALIQEVPKPKVWVKPGPADNERTLDCGGDVAKAEPVEYFWDIDQNEKEPWVKLERKITWKKNETTQIIQQFSCKIMNPVGEKISDPEKNPFYETSPPVAAIVVPLLIFILILAVLAYIYRDAIKKRFCNSGGWAEGNGTVSPQSPQEEPLNERKATA